MLLMLLTFFLMLPLSFDNGWTHRNADRCVNTVDEKVTMTKNLVNFGQGTVPWQPILWLLLKISFCFQRWNKFENQLRFDEVIVMSLVSSFFGTRCRGMSRLAQWRCYSNRFVARVGENNDTPRLILFAGIPQQLGRSQNPYQDSWWILYIF